MIFPGAEPFFLPGGPTGYLLIHGITGTPTKDDASVPPESMQQILDNLGVTIKQMLLVENCGHVIIREPERMHVFQAAENFIQRIVFSKNEA